LLLSFLLYYSVPPVRGAVGRKVPLAHTTNEIEIGEAAISVNRRCASSCREPFPP
jgi:hypothetical protein